MDRARTDIGKCLRWSVRFAAVLLVVAVACQMAAGQGGLPALGGAAKPGAGARTPAPAQDKPEPADPGEVAPGPEPNCQELPVDEALKRTWNSQVNPVLMAGQAPAGGWVGFDDYYTKYFLAQWTQWKNISKLPDFRNQLRNHLQKKSSNGGVQAHDHLNDLVLDFMKRLVAGRYYRATRVNAMLMIGQLNSVEGTSPTPLPEALKVLVAAVESDKLPDAIRAAAMIGVLRHATTGVATEEGRNLVSTAMLRLATSDLPSGPSAGGRQWIMSQCIRTLGILGSPGEGNAVFKALLAAAGNPKLSLGTRTIAADALSHLKYSDADFGPLKTAAVLGRLAADDCSQEIRLLKSESAAVERGRVKQRMDAVLSATKAMIDAAKDARQQTWIGELAKMVKAVSDAVDDPRKADKDVKAAVAELPKKIDAWLAKKPN